VDEDIWATLALDEPIAFAGVEPFDFADNAVVHCKTSPYLERLKMVVGLCSSLPSSGTVLPRNPAVQVNEQPV
jgi:hypothetical protein